jgi:phage protein D
MTETPAVYISRPEIRVEGQANAALGRDVVAVTVEESTDGLYHAELLFTNFGVGTSGSYDYLYFGRDLLDFGKQVEVRLGPGSPPAAVFTGRITALEAEYPEGGGSRLLVLLEDRLQDLRMTRRTRSFEDLSDADVIQQIAGEHGLTPEVNLNGPTHKSLAQVNQSDLAFIRERARACGGEVWMPDDRTLAVKPRSERGQPSLQLEYGNNLRAFRVRADLAHQCTEFVISGWDVAAKDGIKESAGPSLMAAELNGGTGGSAILEQKFSARVASVVHQVPLNASEARGIAEARYRERARRFVTGSAQCDGNAQLHVGVEVDLSGLGAMFNGKYLVTQVRHQYTLTQGFQTEFDVERPGIGR